MSLIILVDAFVSARDEKAQLKDAVDEAASSNGTGSTEWVVARNAFFAKDDVFEAAAAALVAGIQEVASDGDIEDELEAIADEKREALMRFVRERGLEELLNSSGDETLESLILKWRKQEARFTAAQSLNSRRQSVATDELDESLDYCSPNVDAAAWEQVVNAFRTKRAALAAEHPHADADDIDREVSYAILEPARRRLDQATDRLIVLMSDLEDHGRLEREVAELPPELISVGRDATRMVPRRQLAPQTKPEPRPAAVAEPEVETDAELDTDALIDEIEDFLRGL